MLREERKLGKTGTMTPDRETVAASGLSRMAGRVKELWLPRLPRFPEDFRFVPCADGVMVLGAEVQTLRGESVGWVVDRIVPQLDGTRTIAELLEVLPGLREEILRDVLHL